MFQTKDVEKTKMHISCLINAFQKLCCSCNNVERYGRASLATNDNTVHALCMPNNLGKNTATHPKYLIFIAFPWQQWLCKHASMLCYANTAQCYITRTCLNVMLCEHASMLYYARLTHPQLTGNMLPVT